MSTSQKGSVYVAIPTQFNVSGNVIQASKIWANQLNQSYPRIVLNVSTAGVPSDMIDILDGIQYYISTLTIHVLAKKVDNGPNEQMVAEALAESIVETVFTWTSPLTNDVRIFDPATDITTFDNRGYMHDTTVADYILSIKLYHS